MSPRSPEQRALGLTDPLYAAALHPPGWNLFLDRLSTEMGDAAIAMSIMLPGWDLPPEYYRVHLSEEYVPAFERHFRQGLPWPMTHELFRAGFTHGREIFPDEKVAETGYYRDYLAPQGMAPEGPIAHLMVAGEGRPISGLSIQRRVDGRHFTDDDLAMCNLLVPHLAAATAIRYERMRREQERTARTHILDRMRAGVVILDLEQRIVVANRAAQSILEANDGLHESHGVIRAERPRDERALRDLIRTAIGFDTDVADDAPALDPEADPADPQGTGLAGGVFEGGYLSVTRPSGKPAYALVVTRVFASPKLSALGDEVAAIFVTDPAPDQIPHAELLRHVYDLTQAESEVVGLLAGGHSLEEISKRRGVKLATTRTLLKRVYGKTRARRQGDLIRLALASDGHVAREE